LLIEKFQNMSTTKNATEFIASLKQVVDFDEVKSDHAFDRSIMNLSKQLTLSGMPQAFPAIQLMMSAQEDGSNIDHKINLEFKFDLTDHIDQLKICFAEAIRKKFDEDNLKTGTIDVETDCIDNQIHVMIRGTGTNKAKTNELRKSITEVKDSITITEKQISDAAGTIDGKLLVHKNAGAFKKVAYNDQDTAEAEPSYSQ